MIESKIKPKGDIELVIEYKNTPQKEVITFHNAILDTGREALAKVLANEVGDVFELYISRLLFGNGGTVGGVPQVVNSNRTGLFGTTVANKSASSNIDQNAPSQVIFSSVLKFDDANGEDINEIALQLANGDLYSMATFAGVSKTSDMQVTFGWRLSFV